MFSYLFTGLSNWACNYSLNLNSGYLRNQVKYKISTHKAVRTAFMIQQKRLLTSCSFLWITPHPYNRAVYSTELILFDWSFPLSTCQPKQGTSALSSGQARWCCTGSYLEVCTVCWTSIFIFCLTDTISLPVSGLFLVPENEKTNKTTTKKIPGVAAVRCAMSTHLKNMRTICGTLNLFIYNVPIPFALQLHAKWNTCYRFIPFWSFWKESMYML